MTVWIVGSFLIYHEYESIHFFNGNQHLYTVSEHLDQMVWPERYDIEIHRILKSKNYSGNQIHRMLKYLLLGHSIDTISLRQCQRFMLPYTVFTYFTTLFVHMVGHLLPPHDFTICCRKRRIERP